MDLETQLLETLVQSYIRKGLPIAKAMDNPIFDRMPLAKKVAVLEKYKDSSPKPSIDKSQLRKSMLWGAGKGAFTLSSIGGLAHVLADGSGVIAPLAGPKLGAAIAVGAGIGSLMPLLAMRQNKQRDLETEDLFSKNKYLEALAQRSMSHSQAVPSFNLKGLVDGAETAAYESIKNFTPAKPRIEDQ